MAKPKGRRPLTRKHPAVKRLASYKARLKILREFTSEFDAKKFERVLLTAPRTESGRKKRRAVLQKVARSYQTLKPYVARPYKAVRPTNAKNLEELRKYVGFAKLKGLRAVPVQSEAPKAVRVSFDKKHRPIIRVGKHYTEKFFRFPHMPQDVDDAVAMTEKMLPEMPDGIYVIASRHHFLIPTSARRSLLVDELKKFYTRYGANSPEFVRLIFGFKWLASSSDVAHKRLEALKTERGKARLARQDARRSAVIKALKVMDAKLKSARGMTTDEAKKILSNEKRRKARLSKRARATGRR